MSDHSQNKVDNYVEQLLQRVLSGSKKFTDLDIVSRALYFFLVRVANTWLSLHTLLNCSPNQECFMLDAGVLIRWMFDAYLQALFMASDPMKQVERATLYFEFRHVDRYELARRGVKLPGLVGDHLRTSQSKVKGEKLIEEQYDRVKTNFLRPNGIVREKWYAANLGKLADDLQKRAEYDMFLNPSHGCVLSSAFAIERGPTLSPQIIAEVSTTLAGRVAQLNVAHNKLDVSQEDREFLEQVCTPYS
jgi:hypothetical protein